MAEIVYLLWSNKHNAWWKPGGWGYTTDIAQAGEFSRAEAIERVVRSAGCGDRTKVSFMVAAPSNWAPLPDVMRGPLADVLAAALPMLAARKRANLRAEGRAGG